MAQRQFRSDDTDKWVYGFGNGSDGNGSINSSTDAPIDSACSGTSGTTSLSATNGSFAAGQLILIHQTRGTGAGGWELNKIDSYSAGTITTKHNLTMTYTSSGASCAQVIVMKQYNDVTINSGVTYTAKAWNGTVGGITVLLAKGTVTITGSINASSCGFRGGSAINSNSSASWTGESYGQGSVQQNGASYSGGGGCVQQGGGGGGHAGGGQAGQGGGGSACGNAELTSLVFGGGGGGSAGDWSSPPNQGSGGSSGGIIIIIASSIVISGSIINSGGNGSMSRRGCGGGSGGATLLKCKTATLGSNLITAYAGAKGGQTDDSSQPGGDGSVGRIHLDYKTSYTGTTSPTLDVTQDATLDYPASSNFFMFFS